MSAGRTICGGLALGVLASCSETPGRTAGEPDAAGAPWFDECASARGIDFVHQSGHETGRYLLPESVCGGGALFDMDGDGDLDVYLVQSGPVVADTEARPPNRLYRNLGGGWFEDATDGSGAGDRGYGMGVACGDYDGDGLVDLYITNLGPNVLLHNEGDGRFTDATARAGVGDPGFGSSAAFMDYDGDGDLDLFACNYVDWSFPLEQDCVNSHFSPDYCQPTVYDAPGRDVLYRNDGDGVFTDVTEAAGLLDARGTGLGVVPGDFTGDGRIDLFVANDAMPNRLWVNGGDGTFTDAAMRFGCAFDSSGVVKAGMGVAAADVDDDGDLDLLVCNLRGESDSFFLNEGGAYFVDATAAAGLDAPARPYTRFGVGWADFDNDGQRDLYEANGRIGRRVEASGDPYAEPDRLLRGMPGPRWDIVAPGGGDRTPLVATGRAAAFGDVDDDGGVDVLVVNRDGPVHLLRNVVPDRGHWLTIRVLDASGRDALGATVTVRAGGRQSTHEVRAAGSYLASSDPRVHVGLGEASQVDEVTVHWPDGAVEPFGAIPIDGTVTLRRASEPGSR